MTRRSAWTTMLIGLVVMLVMAACGGAEETAGDGASPTPEQDAAAAETEPAAEPTDDAMEPIAIRISTLNFPSLVAVIPPIIQDQGFDEANGLELSVEPFADIGAFYAALTNASVDAGVGGVNVLQRLNAEGADVQIVATFVGLEPLLVITNDPEIQSVADLEGKSIAATVASAEYQILAIYALSQGIDLEQDATLVNASPADVRGQLEAGRVDAGMLWEPGAALALNDNPDYRIIFNGDEAWQELTGERGWELVWSMQRSYIDEHPEVVDRWIATLNDAVAWMFDNPEEAAALMEEASGMPPEAFITVLEQGRVDYDVQPAWEEDVRASIVTHFEQAVDNGFIDSMPSDDIIYEPAS